MADFRHLSDDELLIASRRDARAFGAFYERHAKPVLYFLVRATGDREVALDLTAEVFAATWASLGRYRPGEAPAISWLFGIVRKKLAEIRRGRARADAARRRLGMQRITFDDDELERVEEIFDAELAGYMDGMAALTDDERQAVTARVIEEREYADVAATTGVTETTIRKRVSRGLARLAQRGMGEA